MARIVSRQQNHRRVQNRAKRYVTGGKSVGFNGHSALTVGYL